MLIQQVGPVHVGALFHGTLAVVLHPAAPEDHLPPVVNGLKLHPDIEGVHGPAGEEMAHVERPHHHVHPHRIPAPHGGSNLVQGRHHLEWRGGDHAPGSEGFRLLAHRKGAGELQAGAGPARRLGRLHRIAQGHGENVDADLLVLKEVDGGLKLLPVLVGQGHGRIGAGEPVGVDLAVDVPQVVGIHQGHVAVHALAGLGRVIEGPGPLAGNAAGLPVVVVVESPQPAIVVHRKIQMDLVAARAELGGVLPVEGLHEDLLVRAGIRHGQKIVEPLQDGVVAGGHVMQGGILDDQRPVSHAAGDPDDGVAGGAGQTGLCLRGVDLLPDGSVESPVEENGMVVAAGAPLGGPGADHVLHVFDGLAIPLVVEGGEVVHGGVPLLVDIGMAPLAGVGSHEEIGGNQVAAAGGGRGGEEGTLGSVSLLFHGERRAGRVADAVGRVREGALIAGQGCRDQHQQHCGHAVAPARHSHKACTIALSPPGLNRDTRQDEGQQGQADVRVEDPAMGLGVAHHQQRQGRNRAGQKAGQRPAGRRNHPPEAGQQVSQSDYGQDQAQSQMQGQVRNVEEVGLGMRPQVGPVDGQQEKGMEASQCKPVHPTTRFPRVLHGFSLAGDRGCGK